MKTKTLKLLAIPVLLAASTIGYATDVDSPIDIPLSVTHGSATTTGTFTGSFTAPALTDSDYGIAKSISGSARLDVFNLAPPSGGEAGCYISFYAKDHKGIMKNGLGEFKLTNDSTLTNANKFIGYTLQVTRAATGAPADSMLVTAPGSGYGVNGLVGGNCFVELTNLKVTLTEPSVQPTPGESYSGTIVLKSSYLYY